MNPRAPRALLTEADVRRIRRLAPTTPTRQLADDFGIGLETVRRIVRWDTWRWVSEDEAPARELSLAEIEASKARFLEKMGLPSLGLTRLQAEVAKLHKGDDLLGELGGHSNAGVVGSNNTGVVPETGGGSK